MAEKTKTRSRFPSQRALSNPRYRGKHLVIVEGKIFAATTGQEAAKIFKKVITQYPRTKPTITYVPKENMLILAVKVYDN